MVILESQLFKQFPEIIFGFSTKLGAEDPPYYFNLSLSVGDDQERVKQNRQSFLATLGIDRMVFQKQVHGDQVRYVDKEGYAGESDAMITDQPGLAIMISAADCTSVYIYDYKRKIISGVHAGWRGTRKNILEKTLSVLKSDYKCSPGNMAVYIAPSISCDVYEVEEDVAFQFPEKYHLQNGSRYLLDVSGKNYDTLLGFGIHRENIQYSNLCTFQQKALLHSYRRDGIKSGRSVGIIAMKGRNA